MALPPGNGNYLQIMTAPLGKVVNYDQNTTNGILKSLTDAIRKTTTYTYHAATVQLKSFSKVVDGQTVALGYTYDGDDLAGISHNAT